MIEIRILIAHTAPGLVNVATQIKDTSPMEVEARLAELVSDALSDCIETCVAGTGLKVIRKDYPKPQ